MIDITAKLIEQLHFVKGLDPVANAFAGTVRSDIVNMENMAKVVFVIWKGVGATGTSTVTVEASDDASPSNVTAVPFDYRAILTTDVPGAVTAASSFVTTAGSSQVYVVEVDAENLIASGYSYVSLKMVESAASAVLGGILIFTVPRDTYFVGVTALT